MRAGAEASGAARPPTLICWVLVNPTNSHSFVSRFDFDTSPLLKGSALLPPRAAAAIARRALALAQSSDRDLALHSFSLPTPEPLRCTHKTPSEPSDRGQGGVVSEPRPSPRRSRAVFVNGFCFDDMEPQQILAAVRTAQAAGATVLFDAGPRAHVLLSDDAMPGCREAVLELLETADVVLLTEEEAEAITGTRVAHEAAAALLAPSRAREPWAVVKMGGRGALVATRGGMLEMPGVKVTVADTVGCGDSFAAAIAMGRVRRGIRRLHPQLPSAHPLPSVTHPEVETRRALLA